MRRHWANVDGLAADGAASADIRRTLRKRRILRGVHRPTGSEALNWGAILRRPAIRNPVSYQG
jgi:hypothetical protein